MNYTDDELVKKHVELRKAKSALEADYKEKNSAINTALQVIGGVLNARILALGVGADGKDKNIRTNEGTAFRRLDTFVRVSDKDALKKYLTETGDFSFLDPDVSREGVEKFMEDNGGHTPPGVTVTKIHQVLTRS